MVVHSECVVQVCTYMQDHTELLQPISPTIISLPITFAYNTSYHTKAIS